MPMLFINFTINDAEKFADFQKLYVHMDKVRQPGFEFEEEEPEIDWNSLSKEEIDEMVIKISNPSDPVETRYHDIIPDYVQRFFEAYSGVDSSRYGMFGFKPLEIFNYLEFGLDADLIKLEEIDKGIGIIEYAPYGYPYGGMDRLLMTLRGYELTPLESYNGFEVIEFEWTSEFDYRVTEFPERTKAYKVADHR